MAFVGIGTESLRFNPYLLRETYLVDLGPYLPYKIIVRTDQRKRNGVSFSIYTEQKRGAYI